MREHIDAENYVRIKRKMADNIALSESESALFRLDNGLGLEWAGDPSARREVALKHMAQCARRPVSQNESSCRDSAKRVKLDARAGHA